jgi:hypothetical protein
MRRTEHEAAEAEPTPAELREAQALASALQEQRARGELPRDALEVAALLEYARDGGRLDEVRRARVASGLRRRAKRHAPWPAHAMGWSGALAAAALLALLLREGGAEPHAPPIPAALLQTQARAARGDPAALAALDRAMQSYRRRVHEQLGLLPRAGGT